MKEIIVDGICISLLFFFITFFGYLSYSKKEYILEEEAIPIREEDTITGIDYTITIPNKVDEKTFCFQSNILDSIYHYKDVNTIQNFLVQLHIEDFSRDYLIKDISIIQKNDHSFVKKIPYQKENAKVSFQLEKELFKNFDLNYQIQIEFEK